MKITLQDVLDTLEDLESEPKSMETAEKLAIMLYLRDQLSGSQDAKEASHDKGAPIPADSEFLTLALSADPAAVWPLMDELMETLEMMMPRMYDAVMRRLREM